MKKSVKMWGVFAEDGGIQLYKFKWIAEEEMLVDEIVRPVTVSWEED